MVRVFDSQRGTERVVITAPKLLNDSFFYMLLAISLSYVCDITMMYVWPLPLY